MDPPADDWRLLQEYVANGSHDAFATIVDRYVDMVYSAARRQVRDGHLAEDVTQAVFVALSRKAAHLRPSGQLAVWLLRTTHFAARNAIKMESRRRYHESRAAAEAATATEPERSTMNDIAAAIDEGLLRLNRADSEVLILRYFRNFNLQQTAAALGLTSEAAAKRASRAIGRLRKILQGRGLSISATVLSGWMAAEMLHAAPVGLGGSIVTGVVTTGAVPATVSSIAEGALRMMTMAKIKAVGIVGAAFLFIPAAIGVMALAQLNAPPAAPKSAQTVSPTTQNTPGMVITPAEWMEDFNLAGGLPPMLATLDRAIYIPPQSPDDLQQAESKAITEAQANDIAFHNVAIKVNDLTDPESHRIAIYFFRTDRWPGFPVLVTSCVANELSAVTLPPGNYRALAIDGSGQRFQMLGLPIDWPTPIEVGNGIVARLEFRMSPALTRTVRSSIATDRGIMDLDSRNIEQRDLSVYGRVTLTSGQPVPGALMQVREHKDVNQVGSGIAAPDLQTNMEGYYGLPPVNFPYYVGANHAWPLTDLPGFRWRYLAPNQVYQGKKEVNITLRDWTVHTGTVKGRVVDAEGREIDAFTVAIDSAYWPKVGTTDLVEIENWGIRTAFTNGRFEVKDVPIGPSRLNVAVAQRSKQYPPSAGRFASPAQQIVVNEKQVTEVTIVIGEQTFVPPGRGQPGGRGGRGGGAGN